MVATVSLPHDDVIFLKAKDFAKYRYIVFNTCYFASVFESCFACCHLECSVTTALAR